MSPSVRLARSFAVAVLGAGLAVGPLPGALAQPVTQANAPAAPSTVPVPATPTNLPAEVDAGASYVPANSCDPTAKVGATKLGNLLRATYAGTSYSIDRTCGTDPLPTSEHYDGRAIDWFVNVRDSKQKKQAHTALDWMLDRDATGTRYANARRLGVMYLIWDNRIWSPYRAAEGWRPYSNCATATAPSSDTRCHRDHVHISLSWEGATAKTSYWTGKVATRDYGPCRTADLNWAAPYRTARPTPCPSFPKVVPPAGASPLLKTLTTYSGMVLKKGDTGPVVRAVQQAVGVPVDGSFGATTQTRLKSWQGDRKVAATGVVDAPTWRALLAAHAPKPATKPANNATNTKPANNAANTKPANNAANTKPANTQPAAKPAAKPAAPQVTHPELTKYKKTYLAYNYRGPAVKALQRRLKVSASGWFGPQTKAAVMKVQRAKKLPVTGKVNTPTWKALGA